MEFKVGGYVAYFDKVYRILQVEERNLIVRVPQEDSGSSFYPGYNGVIFFGDAKPATDAEVVAAVLLGEI